MPRPLCCSSCTFQGQRRAVSPPKEKFQAIKHGSQKAGCKPKALTQTHHCQNISWAKARALNFKTCPKKAKSLNNCIQQQGQKNHTRHRAGWSPTPLFFSHKNMDGHCSPLCGEEASWLCNSSVHLHPKLNTKAGKRDHFFSCGLKNPERTDEKQKQLLSGEGENCNKTRLNNSQ